VRLGADILHAAFEAAMNGTNALPFQAIGREAVDLSLAEMVRTDHVAEIVFVTIGTCHIKLTNTLVIQCLTLIHPGGHGAIGLDIHGHAAGLKGDKGGHAEHLA